MADQFPVLVSPDGKHQRRPTTPTEYHQFKFQGWTEQVNDTGSTKSSRKRSSSNG